MMKNITEEKEIKEIEVLQEQIRLLYKKMALISRHLSSFEAFINKLDIKKSQLKSNKKLTPQEKLKQLDYAIDSVINNFEYQIGKVMEHIIENKYSLTQEITRQKENKSMLKKYQQEEAIKLGFSTADKFDDFVTGDKI